MSLSAISIAASGLRATRAGLDVTATNIANAQTPGYARRTIAPVERAAGSLGVAGVDPGTVRRAVDLAARDGLLSARTRAGAAEGGLETARAIETLVNGPSSRTSLSASLDRFGESLGNLVSDPASPSFRGEVVRNADALARAIRDISAGLDGLERDEASRRGQLLARTNATLEELARINAQRPATGATGATLDDRAEMLLGEIADVLPIETVRTADGRIGVRLPNGQSLLEGANAARIGFDAMGLTVNGTTSMPLALSGALASSSDPAIGEARSRLDALARGLEGALRGADLPGATPVFLFEEGVSAGAFRLNPDLLSDPAALTRFDAMTGAGDPRRALSMIGALSDVTIDAPGTGPYRGPIDGFARAFSEIQAGLFEVRERENAFAQARLSAAQDRVAGTSGVDLDEEITRLLMLQTAYGANARVMSVAKEMMDTLLRI